MDFNAYFCSSRPFFILGPCVIESRDMLLRHAEFLKKTCDRYQVPFILKSSYVKANRSSYESFTGLGLERGLGILAEAKEEFNIPVTTDVHETAEVQPVAEVADVLQIPAFLCRQSSLLTTAGLTGRVVSVKKGQFLSPNDMVNVAHKIQSVGNSQIILIERGTMFGYNNLIVDFRSFPTMKNVTPYPVCHDASHCLQTPGSRGDSSGGDVKFLFPLVKAAIAAGADGIFCETHENPLMAKSDRETQLQLDLVPHLIEQTLRIYEAAH